MRTSKTKKGEKIKTIGLSEHLNLNVTSYKKKNGHEAVSMNVPDPQEEHKLAATSQFRLISTGVEVDNSITTGSPVQIQHVESRLYLCK